MQSGKSVVWAVCLSLLAGCESYEISQGKNGFSLGRRLPGDEIIQQAQEIARGSGDYAITYARTYVGSNEHLVTRIDVDDLGHGGYPAVVAGGPGHTFVSVSFTVMRRSEMHFNVTVYGKLPIYRKVV